MKYFFNLEKRRYNAKMCSKLTLENGTIIVDPKKILQHQHKFYQDLYKSDPSIVFNIKNT